MPWICVGTPMRGAPGVCARLLVLFEQLRPRPERRRVSVLLLRWHSRCSFLGGSVDDEARSGVRGAGDEAGSGKRKKKEEREVGGGWVTGGPGPDIDGRGGLRERLVCVRFGPKSNPNFG